MMTTLPMKKNAVIARGVIVVVDRRHHRAAHPGPVEHDLDEQLSADCLPGHEGRDGDDGEQRVTDRVLVEDGELREPLGLLDLDEVGVEYLEHRVPHEQRRRRHVVYRSRQHRKEDVVGEVRREVLVPEAVHLDADGQLLIHPLAGRGVFFRVLHADLDVRAEDAALVVQLLGRQLRGVRYRRADRVVAGLGREDAESDWFVQLLRVRISRIRPGTARQRGRRDERLSFHQDVFLNILYHR